MNSGDKKKDSLHQTVLQDQGPAGSPEPNKAKVVVEARKGTRVGVQSQGQITKSNRSVAMQTLEYEKEHQSMATRHLGGMPNDGYNCNSQDQPKDARSTANMQDGKQSDFLTPVQHARLEIKPLPQPQTTVAGTMPVEVSDVGQSDVLNQILQGDQHSQMVVQSQNSPGLPSRHNQTKIVMNFGTEDNKYESQYLNQSLPNSQTGRCNSPMVVQDAAGSMGVSIEHYQGSIQDIISNAGDDPEKSQQPQMDLKLMHQLTQQSRHTTGRGSFDRHQIQSGGNSNIDTPLCPINIAATANRGDEPQIAGFRPSQAATDASAAAVTRRFVTGRRQIARETRDIPSAMIDLPEESEEYLKLKAEVDNVGFSVETKVRKALPQDLHDFIYPESKVQALKLATRKRLTEYQETLQKLRRTSQSKVDKYISDSHMRQTNQLQKRMDYDDVNVDLNNQDGVITEKIVFSNLNVSPGRSSKVSGRSRVRQLKPASNLKLYDRNDSEMDHLHDFAESAFLSNDSANQRHPFVKLTTHDQQFFSTFFNMSGKVSDQKSRETKVSFFDSSAKFGANHVATTRKPSLMKKSSNEWPLPLSTPGDYESHDPALTRLHNLRNTNKSHLAHQHESTRLDQALPQQPTTSSNSAQFSFTQNASRVPSNLRSSLERVIHIDRHRLLKDHTPSRDAPHTSTSNLPNMSEKYIHPDIRKAVRRNASPRQKLPSGDRERLLSSNTKEKRSKNSATAQDYREVQRVAKMNRQNKQRTSRQLSTQMYLQSGVDLGSAGGQQYKMSMMIESGKIDVERSNARSKLKSMSVMERIQEMQNGNMQYYSFSPQIPDLDEARGYVSAQARNAAMRPFDSSGKNDSMHLPTKNRALSSQMNHSDQIPGINTRRETVDTLQINSQETSLLNSSQEQSNKQKACRQSNLMADEAPLDFDLLWRKSQQQIEDSTENQNQSANDAQPGKIASATNDEDALDLKDFGEPFSNPSHGQESASHAAAKEFFELKPHARAGQPPLTQREHAQTLLDRSSPQPSQINSTTEAQLGQLEATDVDEAGQAKKESEPGEVDEPTQTKLIGQSNSEAEYVDANLLHLDTASLQPSQNGSKSQMAKGQDVAAKSYEVQVLRRALKNELNRIRFRVEKECLVPKRNEHRNFNFGKKDIVHEQLMRDIKENRKYRRYLMGANSKMLRHESGASQLGVRGSQQLPDQFFHQLHNLDSKSPDKIRAVNVCPPDFRFDLKCRASSVRDRQQLSVEMFKGTKLRPFEGRERKSLNMLKSQNLSVPGEKRDADDGMASSLHLHQSNRKSSQGQHQPSQRTQSPLARLGVSFLKLPALDGRFQIDVSPAKKYGSAQPSQDSGEESRSSSSDSDCFVTSVQGGNKNVGSQSHSAKALSNENSYRSRQTKPKNARKKELLSNMSPEELQEYRGRKQFNKFMKILDQWAQAKKEERADEEGHYKRRIRNWQFDHKQAEKNALFEFGKLHTSLDLMVEVMAYIQLRKQEEDQRAVERANHVLNRMQKLVKDEAFRKQLHDADASTRKFINQLLLDLNVDNDAVHLKGAQEAYGDKLLPRGKQQAQHTTRPPFERQFTLEANHMLETMKNSLLRSVGLNRKMQSKVPSYKLKGLRVDKIFMSNATSKEARKKLRADRRAQARRQRQRLMLAGKEPGVVIEEETSSSDSEEHEYRGRLIQFGEATNKFRRIVARHFLSKTVKQLEGSELNSVNPLMIFGLMSFKSALFKVMPQDMCKDLGKKYQFLGFNKWKNEHMRDYVHRCKTPQLENFYGVSSVDLYIDNNIVDQREKKFEEEDLNLNKLFQKNVTAQTYYQQIKKGYLVDRELADQTRSALMNYHDKNTKIDAGRYASVSLDLLHFRNNILYFFNKNIGMAEAKAVSEFLLQVKDLDSWHVYQLAVDGCNISDEASARLLAGLEAQSGGHGNGGAHKEQYLCSIVYGNNAHLGEQGFAQLSKLVPCLSELFISNIKQPAKDQPALIQNLLTSIEVDAQYFMKLRLSNINLCFEAFAPTITSLIQAKSTLQHLDLSLARLEPAQLEEIAFELKTSSQHLKNLNLSYNVLDYSTEEREESSNNFVDHLCEFVSQAEVLNHINLSGLRIPKEKLVQLCDHMKRSERISGIHLSDCGITEDEHLMQEILQMFGLDRLDVPVQRRSINEEARPQAAGTFNRDDLERHRAIGKALRPYMNVDPNLREPTSPRHGGSPQNCETTKAPYDRQACIQQTKLKNHILMSKQIKNYEKAKQINECQYRSGVGRGPPDSFGQFVLTRILNRPELIFNQNTRNDANLKSRFFVKDAMNEWRLSLRDECFVCDRHPYTLIFFERGVLAQNRELKEITDEKILKELKYEFNKEFLKNRTLTPLISGSFINKEYGQVPFQRKLKMLRAPIFSLLALSQCKDFADNKQQVEAIKDGVLKFLRNDTREVIHQMHIGTCFLGWQRVINDMVNSNELTSVHSVNLPDLSAYNVDRLDLFVFAGVFPPGYHQLMIYDPQQERAFCKDFVIQHNKLDQFPEYPTINKELGEKFKKIVSNVWVKWKEETQEDHIMAYEHITERENFVPQLVPNARDSQKCIQIIRKSMKKLITFQRELIAKSPQYPLVDQQLITDVLLAAQEQAPASALKGRKVVEEEIKQAIMLAQQAQVDESTHKSRIDVVSARHLNEGLDRTHLVKMLMILAQIFVAKHFQAEHRLGDYLPAFLETYLGPTLALSKTDEQRRTIRASAKLNELLFDNIMGLKEIVKFARLFDESVANRLSKTAAREFFMELTKLDHSPKLVLSSELIDDCFCRALMPVINEYKAAKKYDGLTFVEVLDLLARLAMVGFEEADTVEHKVYWLLEVAWTYMVEVGEWQETEYPLQKVAP